MSRKILFIICLLLLSTLSLHAQRVQVLDNYGLPVPFVTATTPEGKYIASIAPAAASVMSARMLVFALSPSSVSVFAPALRERTFPIACTCVACAIAAPCLPVLVG